MSEQVAALQRPANNDKVAWKTYWMQQGQPWRKEPEIDVERQKNLAKRRKISADIKQDIYPFKDVKLSRADVEWLLATHHKRHEPFNESNAIEAENEALDLRGADLREVDLRDLPLTHIRGGLLWNDRLSAKKEQRRVAEILIQNAFDAGTQLEGLYFKEPQLEGANFAGARLEGANLAGAQLENTLLYDVFLCDKHGIGPRLVDVQWGNTNLAVIDWSKVKALRDEQDAHQKPMRLSGWNDENIRLDRYRSAVRANRQLAIALQGQGLNEEASRFAYRAQLLQRKVLWHQHNLGRWLFSMLLALLSGYGYRIWRILASYIIVVSLFALAYFILGMHFSPHLHLDQAYLESITAFHGRVFLEQFSTDSPQIWLTAFEAITGLIIEGVFIAMLIQRFFGK